MGDKLSRIERDRALYASGNRQQLIHLITNGNPQLVGGAIARALELQVVTEEIARERGVKIDEDAITGYIDGHREYVAKEVDRALNAFIYSIVSQEG